ncbi:MAG: hypothetical protein ABI871_06995 [Chthoniobacterales bacterium]
MKFITSFIFVLLTASVSDARPDNAVIKGDVVIVPLRGEVSPPLLLFLRRAVKAAENAGASAIVFEMNTYGGRLDTAEEITIALNHSTIPTYTFVNTNAGSAGALIALATRHIFMAPVSAIGAAAPVLGTGEDLPSTQRDKTISYWSALSRGSAMRNGHNPDIGEAFINKEKEVKIGDRVVHARGSLLSLSAQEATEQFNGKPLLAERVVESAADLIAKASLSGRQVAFAPTGFEQFAFWITAFAPLLLLGGIIGAYLEFKIPGASLPGLISAICFALFFFGHYIAGLAGWEVVALFVLGLFLVLIEILFFAHSTIVFGLVGVFLMLGSLLWAMIDRYPNQTFFPTGRQLAIPVLNLLAAIVAAAVVIAILARLLPHTSVYRRFILSATNPPGPSLAGVPREWIGAALVTAGSEGVSLTNLRPSGKARFDDRVVDVVTGGEYVAAQKAVKIISADGMRIVVKECV